MSTPLHDVHFEARALNHFDVVPVSTNQSYQREGHLQFHKNGWHVCSPQLDPLSRAVEHVLA
jgi:hypothetical protein